MTAIYKDMYSVFHPYNTEGAIALVAIIVWVILSVICREQFGGFFSALKSIGIAIIALGILWWIHPAFAIAGILAAVLQATDIVKGNWPYGLIAIAMVAAAIWKYFL